MKVKITDPLWGASLYYACAPEAEGGLYFISHLYLESLWTATADGLWPERQARQFKPVPVKDI